MSKPQHKPVGFREFLIGDLLGDRFGSIKQVKSQGLIEDASFETGISFVIQSEFNNMTGRTVNKQSVLDNGGVIDKGNKLVLGVTLGCVSYHPEMFSGSQLITIDMDGFSENVILYFLAFFEKNIVVFNYRNKPGVKKYKALTIQLPVLANNQPDYEYMDYFVEELKHKYVEELDAWWSQAGFASLPDTLLTGNDQDILNKYQQAQFKDFLIGDLFDVKGTNQVFQNDELDVHDNQTDIYNVPYVVRKDGDNGIKGYVDGSLVHSDDLNQGNVITFAQDTFVSYYQPYPFITGNKIKILIFKDGDLSFNLSQWFVSGINKLIKGLSWGTGSTVASIKELTIQLPVDINDQPDYDLISQYMQVMKKLTIQTHRAWLDEQLAEYQSLI